MKILKTIEAGPRYIHVYRKFKIFRIGTNKTGTTSLNFAINAKGWTVDDKRKAGELGEKKF